MQFTVLPAWSGVDSSLRSQAFLITDNWDDYGYKTQYRLVYVDSRGVRHSIGNVKIGQFRLEPDEGPKPLRRQFEQLPSTRFSLGQDESYYTNLNDLGPDIRDVILRSLRDVASDEELFERALHEKITGISLLRFVTAATVSGQFRRLARGGVRLTEYAFAYTAPSHPKRPTDDVTLTFDVEPESHPPTNIHVLIGRNGVGKTRMLHFMSRALVDSTSDDDVGTFTTTDATIGEPFANLVSVSFSAFDEFEPLRVHRNKSEGMQYAYIGLKRVRIKKDESRAPNEPAQLSSEFVDSVLACRTGTRVSRWRRALEVLEGDPIFRDANVVSLAEPLPVDPVTGEEDLDGVKKSAKALFRRLSSGHKIVLLTITRLVETVAEGTLVLLDEPEAHLHPPLLAAFVRSLSDLLTNRNGVAIIATHSPVILQEVPRGCVWKIHRSGSITTVERPEIETFGENVGILTREIFGLEVTRSGFHRLLADAVARQSSYEAVLRAFNGQLGGEARALVRALFASQRDDDDQP